MTKPLTQVGAGSDDLQPEVDGRLLLTDAAGPEAFHEDAEAVVLGRRFISALEFDHGTVRSFVRGDGLPDPEDEVGLGRFAAAGLDEGGDLAAVVMGMAVELGEDVLD